MTAKRTAAGLLAAALLAAPILAHPAEPAPPYPPYPPYPTRTPPPPRTQVYRPPPRVVGAPPPLSPVMRVVYAPFYVAGLVLRYGVYYTIVAPLEVFSRALDYGVEGGVRRSPPRDAEESR